MHEIRKGAITVVSSRTTVTIRGLSSAIPGAPTDRYPADGTLGRDQFLTPKGMPGTPGRGL